MKSKHLRLVLTAFLSIFVISTITAIACAPAAPPGQTAPTKTPANTPTPTRDVVPGTIRGFQEYWGTRTAQGRSEPEV